MSFAATTNSVVSPLAGARDTQLADQGTLGRNDTTVGTGIISTASLQTSMRRSPTSFCFNSFRHEHLPMFLRPSHGCGRDCFHC